MRGGESVAIIRRGRMRPSSAGGLRGGPRRLIWMMLFTVSMVRCAGENDLDSEAGGGGGQGDNEQGGTGRGRSASLAQWRRQCNRAELHEPNSRGAGEAGGAGGARGRPCGDGEHTDGRWVAKAAGEMEARYHFFHAEDFFNTDIAISSLRNFYRFSCKDWVDDYAWRPTRCSLATWDAAAFCDALKGRSMQFIGDSVMLQVTSLLPPQSAR